MSFVEVQQVSYRKGGKEIFKNLNFNLEKGRIIALLGENGSGKTTIMRLLSGLALNWRGKITVDNAELSYKTKNHVAFLVDLKDFSKEFTVKQVLDFYRRFYADYSEERAQDLIVFMELDVNAKIKTLSKGQQEKVALVATLARKAAIYLLDEPLSGIDLLTREKIIQSLLRWFEEDSLLLITTHQMAEIENIVDEVMILKDQEIVLHQSIEKLREERGLGLESLYREVLS